MRKRKFGEMKLILSEKLITRKYSTRTCWCVVWQLALCFSAPALAFLFAGAQTH